MCNNLNNSKNLKLLKNIKAIIFDLDGTLITNTDFKLLKKELNLDVKVDVLEVLSTYSIEERAKAEKIIYEFELRARNQTKLQDHVESLLEFLELNNIPKAIHSRNSLENINHFVERVNNCNNNNGNNLKFKFNHLVGREIQPPKPNPAGSFDILRVFNETCFNNSNGVSPISPDNILFIGDSMDDITTSKSFGSISLLLVNEHNKHNIQHADLYISNFSELIDILEKTINK